MWAEYGDVRRIPLVPPGSLLPETHAHWPTNQIFRPRFAEGSVSPCADQACPGSVAIPPLMTGEARPDPSPFHTQAKTCS